MAKTPSPIVFFFQAEDGIRDRDVTGVQTCALPISLGTGFEDGFLSFLDRDIGKELLRFTTAGSVDDGKSTLIGRLLHDSKAVYEDQLARSEERRVGKEWRSRWAPELEEKNVM